MLIYFLLPEEPLEPPELPEGGVYVALPWLLLWYVEPKAVSKVNIQWDNQINHQSWSSSSFHH